MHKKDSLDYVYVMTGSIRLILDEGEVDLEQGDTVVNISANHAWSNITDTNCELFISSHGTI
jgi:quercetin dioxygenase-like cupin family protein